MPGKILRFEQTWNMFGANIDLVDAKKSIRIQAVKSFNPPDPLKNQIKRLKNGYLFRRPGMPDDEWEPVFELLARTSGKFSLRALYDQKATQPVTAYIRFGDKDDASMFAWTHGSTWQKWSDELETQEKAESAANPSKIRIGKDGRITVTVKTTTLGK